MNTSLTEVIETKLSSARVQDVLVTDDALAVDLDDGRTISVPLAWYPRLAHGTPEERDNWRISGAGWGVHWPDLDEDISVKGLLIGNLSGESQRSFAQWLAIRGRHSHTRSSASSERHVVLKRLIEKSHEILSNLRQRKTRLGDYDDTQSFLLKTNVSNDSEYQRIFRSFYVVRKDKDWCNIFFSILERDKRNSKISFQDVIREIHDRARHGGRQQVEPSFSSKLVATINPHLPVYDSKVKAGLGLSEKSPYQIHKTIKTYSQIQAIESEIIADDKFNELIVSFDQTFPQYKHFTDTKKLDLFLWAE